MAVYIKRLKGKRINVVHDIIETPITIANRVFNPILRYMDEQYNEIAPRGKFIQWNSRNSDEQAMNEDDSSLEDTEENLFNSTEYWWNVDYYSTFSLNFQRFEEIVDGVKNNTLQKSEELVSELYQVYENCAHAIEHSYLAYCFAYESWLILAGVTPKSWWILNDFSTPRYSPQDSPEHWATIYVVGGQKIAGLPESEWVDSPYEWDITWVYWLNPFNWGKSEYDIRNKKQHDKWKNYLDHKKDSGEKLTQKDGDGVWYFGPMNTSMYNKNMGGKYQ